MISIRKAQERGRTSFDWLDSRHTFSFGEYYDPAHSGFSVLRVINDDWIAPSRGFPTHPHRDMEIVTYVLKGAVEHRDSTGTHGTVGAGEVQRMTAGTGIMHSEMNPSSIEPLHLLQIWILPSEAGLRPGYEQKSLAIGKVGRFIPIASRDGSDGALKIHQDAAIYRAEISARSEASFEIARARKAYVHVVKGKLSLNGAAMDEADGAMIAEVSRIEVKAEQDTELLLFDLP